MKIGYCVEGSTDRATLRGLNQRWCPHAQLVEGSFRGTSGLSQRREIPKTCIELRVKGAELIVFLRDANNENWREVLKADEGRCRPEHKHLAIFGVCDRNVECWLCADADWLGKKIGHPPNRFRVADPKGPFTEAMGITASDKKEKEIAELVGQAPLKKWLSNESFEAFYERIRTISIQNGCQIENLRESR